MDNVELEIVVISANDLKDGTNFGWPMRSYAIVCTDSATQKRTRVDRHGGSYPTWNDKLRMPVSKSFLQQKGSHLLVKIYCKSMFGKKKIGSARMPYSDILEGYASPDSIQFVSYRVRRPNGMPRGTIDMSVRFLDKITSSHISRSQCEMKFSGFSSKSQIRSSCSTSNRRPQSQHSSNGNNNGHAIGIPLSQFAYPTQQHPRGTATVIANSNPPMPPLRFAGQNSIYSGPHNTWYQYGSPLNL